MQESSGSVGINQESKVRGETFRKTSHEKKGMIEGEMNSTRTFWSRLARIAIKINATQFFRKATGFTTQNHVI
jgi:hypothetical protein